MERPTLHLLMGLPGAGKSTLADTLSQITGARIISSDTARMELFEHPTFSQTEHDMLYEHLDEIVVRLLKSGQDAIYDANLNRKRHREEKYRLAQNLNAKICLWWVQTPKELAKSRRVQEQNHILLPDGESPERMFERIASVLEAPSDDENFIAVDGTKVSEEYIKQLLKQ